MADFGYYGLTDRQRRVDHFAHAAATHASWCALPIIGSFDSHPYRRVNMLGIGDKLPEFSVTGVKPGFNSHEENGESAFEAADREELPRQVEGDLLLPEGLHLRLPDRDRRIRPPRRAISRTATQSCSAARPTTSSSSSPGVATTRISTGCRSGRSPTPMVRSSMASAFARRTASPIASPSSSIPMA